MYVKVALIVEAVIKYLAVKVVIIAIVIVIAVNQLTYKKKETAVAAFKLKNGS